MLAHKVYKMHKLLQRGVNAMADENPARTTKYAAKALGISVTTLLSYIRSDELPDKPTPRWRGKQKLYDWSDELIGKYRAVLHSMQR